MILRPSKSLSRAAKVTRPVANFVRRLHHVGGVFVLGGVRVKVEHSCDALGNGAGGKHDDSAVRNALGLLGGHNDVFVVGQHKHRLGGHALHSGHDIGRGGIHRLPAGHHGVSAKVGEDGLEALACGDGHEAKRPVVVHGGVGELVARIRGLGGGLPFSAPRPAPGGTETARA